MGRRDGSEKVRPFSISSRPQDVDAFLMATYTMPPAEFRNLRFLKIIDTVQRLALGVSSAA